MGTILHGPDGPLGLVQSLKLEIDVGRTLVEIVQLKATGGPYPETPFPAELDLDTSNAELTVHEKSFEGKPIPPMKKS